MLSYVKLSKPIRQLGYSCVEAGTLSVYIYIPDNAYASSFYNVYGKTILITLDNPDKFEPKSNVPLHIDKFKEFSCPILLLSSPNTLFNVLTPGNANIINDRHPENALSSIDDADNTCIDVKFEQFLNASALISLRYMLE